MGVFCEFGGRDGCRLSSLLTEVIIRSPIAALVLGEIVNYNNVSAEDISPRAEIINHLIGGCLLSTGSNPCIVVEDWDYVASLRDPRLGRLVKELKTDCCAIL